ncbi:MAG: folylpolyglutamate synthase [Rickettsiaceae bacterium]|jgi:dihydrofolate synthase/folylpolyglutamate synthase|nr:folylpolyglutamate synthase [Rickettsiaceae bacterium]
MYIKLEIQPFISASNYPITMVYLPHFPIPNKLAISDNSPEKLQKILTKLGSPQENLPPVIHVAGTNGKGSAIAFLASIFQSAGYKTHIYTSPHLHHCNERIVISGNQIDDGYLYEILEEVRLASDGVALTLFEGLTLAAILAFSKNPADICLIETGMGGRVDATNVIDKKIATILTPISFDHQEFLGNSLFAIACEKSHTMRPNVPCIIAAQDIEAAKAIKLRSVEITNPLFEFGKDFRISVNEDGSFDFKYLDESLTNLAKPGLPGWHQYFNSALAIAAICLVRNYFSISKDQINEGLKSVKWPSRLEKLHHKLLKEDDELWIDGAHNPNGAEALSDWVKEQIVDDFEKQKPKRNYLITGFSKNKAKQEFFTPFKDVVDFICAVRVKGEPNPEEAEIITQRILESGIEEVLAKENLSEAIDFLVNLDSENPCRIIICGSLYLARDLI